jgi:hypothetical protein
MIQESVREMTAAERAPLRATMQPPALRPRPLVSREGWLMAAAWLLVPVVLWLRGERSIGGYAGVLVLGAGIAGYHLVSTARAAARQRRNHATQAVREAYAARTERDRARILEDGRVVVKRVRAEAVVEIEALEDEGTGYVFDVGEGRVLFIKGPDVFPSDDEMPWPNTEFEIVRTAAEGWLLDVHCHGTALPPLRVVSRDDVDPQKGWDEREEVLEMSLDDAVRSILRNP